MKIGRMKIIKRFKFTDIDDASSFLQSAQQNDVEELSCIDKEDMLIEIICSGELRED